MFKGMKSLVAAVGVAGVLAGASAAQAASSVIFDIDGLGGNPGIVVDVINLNPGNTVAVGGNINTPNVNYDVYFQTSVASLNYDGSPVVPGVGFAPYYITVITKFSEQLNGVPELDSDGNLVANFTEGTGTDEYFEVWLHTQAPNNLTGEGFGSDNAGVSHLLLRGENVTLINGVFKVQTTNGVPDVDLFDQNGTDQYGNMLSVLGTGSNAVRADIDYVNSDFISGINVGDAIDFLLANPASTAIPFDSVNPAQKFWDASTNSYVTPDLGFINGLPGGNPDFQFQTNGNLTFEVTNTPVIPEPATAAMGLFGLAGLAMAARRRR